MINRKNIKEKVTLLTKRSLVVYMHVQLHPIKHSSNHTPNMSSRILQQNTISDQVNAFWIRNLQGELDNRPVFHTSGRNTSMDAFSREGCQLEDFLSGSLDKPKFDRY
jgi:uncharacterized protein (DUF736 family)